MPMSPRLLRPRASGDPDAGRYIAAVQAADGQALEPAVRQAIEAFVRGCKQDGIWSAIKASCILMGARTLSGAITPLVGTAPTNNNFVSGDYDRKTGLAGNGTTKSLNSNRNNNADPQNSFHLSVYRSVASQALHSAINIGGGAGTDAGRSAISTTYNQTANDGFFFRSRSASANEGLGGPAGGSDILANGFVGMSRTSANNVNWRTPTQSGSFTRESESPFNGNIGVFASASGSIATTFSPSRLAFYSIGESLTLSSLDSRVTTLYNAIGAAIP